jgi:hypothetical protein
MVLNTVPVQGQDQGRVSLDNPLEVQLEEDELASRLVTHGRGR